MAKSEINSCENVATVVYVGMAEGRLGARRAAAVVYEHVGRECVKGVRQQCYVVCETKDFLQGSRLTDAI
jgi:hypothetical protein